MSVLSKRTLWAIVSLIIIYPIFYHWFDLPIARYCHSLNGDQIAAISRTIGDIFSPKHWTELALLSGILGVIAQIFGSKQQAKPWLLFAASVIVALFITSVLKFGLARYRPIEYFEHGLYGFHWLSTHHNFNSTPSGHSTAAFAGFTALAIIARLRIVWVLCILAATLIAISRVIAGAHYPSDVIFGAYVALLSCYWMRHFFYQTKEKQHV